MMFRLCIAAITALVLLFNAVAGAGDSPSPPGQDAGATSKPCKTLAENVIEAARSYPDGGGYKWAGSGACEDIKYHDGRVILARSAEGTYCCGFTFSVVMKAADSAGLLEGKTFEQLKKFQRDWYGVSSDKSIVEKQVVPAMVNLGIGAEVRPDEAQAGDFLQFWRGKSGHSVVFLDWVEKDGKRVGFNYRSSQKATDGIGDHIEYLNGSGIKGGEVDANRMYFARLGKKP